MKEKIWTRSFLVVCLSSFFMFLTFYILATAFPLYVKDSLNGNEQQMGLAITIYVVGGVLLRPFSGQWVDRFGKKKMAVIGMAVFLAASLCYFGAKGILLFLVVRLIHGMSYAVASTATSTVASAMIPDSRQGEGMGYFSMFMSIAMVIGPAMGLFLWKDKNINVLLLAVSAIAALSLLFTLLIKLPRQQAAKDGRGAALASADSGTNAAFSGASGATAAEAAAAVAAAAAPETAGRKKRLSLSGFIEPKAVPISLVGFILAFSYSSLSGFMSSFANEIHQTKVTSYFFVVFAIMIVAFRPVIGKIFDKYKEHYLYYPGIVLFAIGMIMLSQAHSSAMVLIAGVVMGIGYGALIPCFQALAMKLAPAHRRGSANGTFFLLFDLGYGLGSYFMGLIASYSDYRLMYLVAGLVPLLSVAVYYVLHHRHASKGMVRGKEAKVI
ncbi:MFS transporter [Paenibacillus physcomitrellae]|uniref:MFS transporter n=1 Tax=Paenibacillus physcomitrellae TaxID=1619311 RepID=A0ABQ1GF33_9BACL|nr:MFS transporter [Paenibacillus physcomitrellae]GGA42303.1 MFS transporter [Paenibacillus physcomitrellae]